MTAISPLIKTANTSVMRIYFAGGCTKGVPELFENLLVVPLEDAATTSYALCQIGVYGDILDQEVTAVGTDIKFGTLLFDDGAGAVTNTPSDYFYGYSVNPTDVTAAATETILALRALSLPANTVSQVTWDALAVTSTEVIHPTGDAALITNYTDADANLIHATGDAALVTVYTDADANLIHATGDAALVTVYTDADANLIHATGDAALVKVYTDADTDLLHITDQVFFSSVPLTGKTIHAVTTAVTGVLDLDLSTVFATIDYVIASYAYDAATGVKNHSVVAEPGGVAGHVDICSMMPTAVDDCTLIDNTVTAINVTLLVIGDPV